MHTVWAVDRLGQVYVLGEVSEGCGELCGQVGAHVSVWRRDAVPMAPSPYPAEHVFLSREDAERGAALLALRR